MKGKLTKANGFAVLLAFLGAAGIIQAQAQENPRDIVKKSRERVDAKTTMTQSRMVVTDKNGGTSEMVMNQYEKRDAKGNYRSVVEFQKPASVKGTRFLTLDNKDRGSDQIIFLPGLGKTRRIASSEGSGSFMGTDLSYDDVSSAERDVDLDNHVLTGEETLNGHPCYVIESKSKDGKYQYSKIVQWIDKETYIPWKLELYNAKGQHEKTLESLKAEDKQGRLVITQRKMSTLGKNTSTTINTDRLEYDKNIPESVFTEEFLKTGKAR